MGYGVLRSSQDKEFIISERWKCEKSPSGAHHWIISNHNMICKHCSMCKELDNNRFGRTVPIKES